MALHRDIYWVGKQWAVTGHGIQACNQKQRGQFDIAASSLWDDGVQEAVRSLSWVNQEDFDKAIATARKYYPEPPRKTLPPEKPAASEEQLPLPEAPPVLAAPNFDMRVEGLRAKLVPVWRVRTRVAARPNNR